MRAALLLVCVGCHAEVVEHTATPPEGISIALYDRGDGTSYGVVDDRRWIEVTAGHPITLERIDPGAALPSLVIESLAGGALVLGACWRATIDRPEDAADKADELGKRRLATIRARIRELGEEPEVAAAVAPPTGAPTVSCELAHAQPGRHLVRILYVSRTLGFRTQHALAMTTADRAVVTSHFAIATPPWHVRGEVTLYDNLPGGDKPPRELTHGPVTLDGTTSVLALPAREVAAHLRRIYDGALIVPGMAETDQMWNHRSTGNVVVWLELADIVLAPGEVRVHVEQTGEPPRDVDLPARPRAPGTDTARLPLWDDPDLRGMRQPGVDHTDAASLADRLVYSVTNVGTVPHEVWIEEHLRPAKRRRVVRAWPTKPAVHDDLLRTKLTIAPGKIERLGFTVDYDF